MDYQRKRVYDSEDQLEQIHCFRKWKTVESCQRYVDDLTSSRWFKNRWGNVKISVASARKNARNALAYVEENKIVLPNWAKNEIAILHEVAHCLMADKSIEHRRRFCEIYLKLIERQLGKRAKEKLIILYLINKVKYKKGA